MSKASKRSTEVFDDSDLFSDEGFDLHSFIDSMEERTGGRPRGRKRSPSGRQRLDQLSDARWLRDQLQDWDDWDDESQNV